MEEGKKEEIEEWRKERGNEGSKEGGREEVRMEVMVGEWKKEG